MYKNESIKLAIFKKAANGSQYVKSFCQYNK